MPTTNPQSATNHQPPATSNLWQRWHLGALLAHALLTAFFTWPLLLNFLPGADALTPGLIIEDRDQNLWNLWWVREAVLSGRNPFVTDYIYHPDGVSLYFHTLNVFNGLLAVPLLSIFSLATTYNLIVFVSFAVTGWGAFLLVHYLCGNRWAALVGSVVFAYSAYHIATMRGLLQLISLEWVPFFVLALLWATYAPPWSQARDIGRWALRRALPAGVALFLVSLVDWYYTMYALMMVALLGLYQVGRFVYERATLQSPRKPHLWRDLGQPLTRIGICLFVWGALVSPILIPTLNELRQERYMVPSSNEAVANSADLLAFFQPSRDNRLWGRNFDRRDWEFGNNLYEVYLTYTALILVGVGLFAKTQSAEMRMENDGRVDRITTHSALPSRWFWAGGALLFFFLALGPTLQVGGERTGFPMPYSLLERVPALNISRSPDRFAMPLTLCLGVLAGYGTNRLMRWLETRRQTMDNAVRSTHYSTRSLHVSGPLIALPAIALIALELAPVPYPQQPAETPRWYSSLKAEAGDFTVFELPPQDEYWHGAFRMYYATTHGRPIFTGYISREYGHPFIENTPGYMTLVSLDGEGDMLEAGREEGLSALDLYQTRYVVLQKDRLPDITERLVDVSKWRVSIERVLGSAPPTYEDEQLAAYRVPEPPQRVPFLSIGVGWEPREVGPNGPFRWMSAEATLLIDAPTRAETTLRFRATTIGPPRRFVLRHGDAIIFDERVSALREYAVQLDLPGGKSVLHLSSPEGTVSPRQLGLGEDRRELGFALLDVKLEP